MIRDVRTEEREIYLALARAFYQSEAVLHPVPEANLERTFEAVTAGSPFVRCLFLEENGVVAGFALLAHTWSQEAGGEVVWIEELFIEPQFRGRGLATSFFCWLEANYPHAARLRLEIEPGNRKAEDLYRRMGFEFLNYRQMVAEKGCK